MGMLIGTSSPAFSENLCNQPREIRKKLTCKINRELQENIKNKHSKCEEIQEKLSQVGDDLKIFLQKQASLEENLNDKENVNSLMST